MSIFIIGDIGRAYRHMQRYRQILTAFFKYGFGDLVTSLKIEQYLEIGLHLFSGDEPEAVKSLSRASRARLLLEELGPSFLKLGQILSTRPDLLPLEFTLELAKLQDDVAPFPFSEAKALIEEEFGKPLDDIFQSFEETPLAAASIGQVHMAELVGGQVAAVKVQRPGIRRLIEVDIEIMAHLATLMERHSDELAIHQPTRIVEEFARTLERELDYSLEASNMERFAQQFAHEPTVYAPKVFREASASRVLSMEYIQGVKASDLEGLKRAGCDRKKIAQHGLDLIMEQIFVHGFFHADPHPGNIFVLADDVICFIDFGMMGRLGRNSRERFADLVMNIAQRDEKAATKAILQLTIAREEPDTDALERDVMLFMDQHCYRPLKDVRLYELLHQVIALAARHQLTIPPDLILMIKALGAVEGLGRLLDPDFDVIAQAAPFIERVQLRRLNPWRLAKEAAQSGKEFLDLARDAPRELRALLKLARQGRIKIEFAHRGLEPLLLALERISNRLSFAVVLASLVIGSALIVHSGIPPKWQDIPVIGLIGFLVAGIMGFWLLITIMRGGKM